MFGKKFLVRLFVFFKNSKKVCKNTHNVGDGEVHRFKSLSIMKRKAKRVSCQQYDVVVLSWMLRDCLFLLGFITFKLIPVTWISNNYFRIIWAGWWFYRWQWQICLGSSLVLAYICSDALQVDFVCFHGKCFFFIEIMGIFSKRFLISLFVFFKNNIKI